MQPERPPSDPDGIPSFHSIVEDDLGDVPRPTVRWQGQAVIPAEVLAGLLPQYERWEFLGVGGMGVVYKAWHRELMRWSAVKFLGPDQCRDARALARFQNEAAVLAQLRHPNIVPVHDFGSEEEVAWLVMDYVDGVPLQIWAQETRKPVEIARMMAKISRAVGVAHASGITHRDLKPGNILIVAEEPVLLDFGLAQSITWQQDIRLTRPGELAGTVAYLAPEQVQPSLGEPAPATDVHACGVMLYELMAGRLPRLGSAGEIITRLHEDDLPPRLGHALKTVRKELDAICWKAMQKIPEHRYANGTSLAEDLERFLDGRPVRARNPDLLDLACMYVRRNPWALVAAGVAVVGLLMFAWSSSRLHWSQEKAELLSQINRQLSEPDWTPDRLTETDGLLRQMREMDPVLEKYLEEDVVKRTYGTVIDQLDAPRLTEAETVQVGQLVNALKVRGHPESQALMERLRGLETAWQTVSSLRYPISTKAGCTLFRPNGWETRLGRIHAVPLVEGQTWSTLSSVHNLDGAVELELEYGEGWQTAKACGVALKIPLLKDIRFYIFSAERFAQHEPEFANSEKLPVLAILSEMVPLAYETLPAEALKNPRLVLRCRYENGELSMAVNGRPPLRHTRIYELARPLAESQFSVLVPIESSLVRVEVRERQASSPASPLVKADDLVSMGRAQEAMVIYEKYLNQADVKTECLYKYAACLEALRKMDEAISMWEDVAHGEEEPWKGLAMFQLWRTHLNQGDMTTANSWFDLMMASNPTELVRMGIPTGDRLLLNQHYLPVTRSLNCLKVRPEDLPDLDRAVRVQQFLGADDRQLAARTAMAFHFAGQDQRARQLLSQAVSRVRPSPSLPGPEAHITLICLDQWAALGDADGDAVLKVTVTSWRHALQGSRLPARAIPALEDMRADLRAGQPFRKSHLALVKELGSDPEVMLRHRLEAWLIAGVGEQTPEGRQNAWKQAAKILEEKHVRVDNTQQKLHSEFVARSLAQSWTPAQATEWMSTLVGKGKPLVSKDKWIGPLVQTLVGSSLARNLNASLQNERGQRFARDYILRARPGRELAYEGMELVWTALFSEGTGWPADHEHVKKGSEEIVKAFCQREITEVMLMQLFTLWNGVKNAATWESIAGKLTPELSGPLTALLNRRYERLGHADWAAEFIIPAVAKEKPAPKTTRVVP